MSLFDAFRVSLNLYRNRLTGKKNRPNTTLNTEQESRLRELQSHGVVKIENYLSPDECDIIRSKMDAVIQEHNVDEYVSKLKEQPRNGWDTDKGYRFWVDKHASDIRLIGAETIHPLINQFFKDQSLVDIGAAYLSADLRVRHTMANRVVYRQENLGSGGGWHRDMTYRRGFKAMVYLSDVTAETGPFQYIPHSDSALYHLFRTNFPEQYQFSHEEIMKLVHGNTGAIQEATGPKGTLLLFETNLIHRGKPIQEGQSRYAMTNYHNF